MQRLQSAGHAVKVATEHLVNAARQAITENDCRGLVISDSKEEKIFLKLKKIFYKEW